MKLSKVLQFHREDIRLHLGCGPNRLPGWINCEFANTINEEWQVEFDLIKFPYDIEDNTVSRIYWSHVIEHIDPPQVPRIVSISNASISKIFIISITLLSDGFALNNSSNC